MFILRICLHLWITFAKLLQKHYKNWQKYKIKHKSIPKKYFVELLFYLFVTIYDLSLLFLVFD